MFAGGIREETDQPNNPKPRPTKHTDVSANSYTSESAAGRAEARDHTLDDATDATWAVRLRAALSLAAFELGLGLVVVVGPQKISAQHHTTTANGTKPKPNP